MTEKRIDLLELCGDAWAVIANAGGGNWANEKPEWQEAAIRWRERFHIALDTHLEKRP